MRFNKIQNIKDCKEQLIKAEIISTEGSVPREAGDYMFITKEDIFGTIGGGQLELIVINKAKKLLKTVIKKTETLNIPLGPGIGQCCGGYVQIQLTNYLNGDDIIKREKNSIKKNDNLFIFGAGHIGQALSSKSSDLNFEVHLIDSRKNFLYMNDYRDVEYIFATKPWELIKNLPRNSYYIVLTHSHDYDFKIINEILFNMSFKFVGLIGSKTKKIRFANRLKDNGHNKSLIDLIDCPIGLNFNHSKEPGEISISIMAKLIDYRNNLYLQNPIFKKKINEK